MLVVCGQRATEKGQDAGQMSHDKTIEEVLTEHTDAWMSISGVTGTGIGKCGDTPCIRIYVSGNVDDVRSHIPDEVDGYMVDLVVTGRFEARDTTE